MKKVEKLEDINVMEGIDFKQNQLQMKKNEAYRKQYLKLKRNRKIEDTLLIIAGIGMIIALILFVYKFEKRTQNNVNECVNNGYTRQYCEKSILGN